MMAGISIPTTNRLIVPSLPDRVPTAGVGAATACFALDRKGSFISSRARGASMSRKPTRATSSKTSFQYQIWLVEAMLRSQTGSAPNRAANKSGIKRTCSAFCSSSGSCSRRASSWNKVLIAMI